MSAPNHPAHLRQTTARFRSISARILSSTHTHTEKHTRISASTFAIRTRTIERKNALSRRPRPTKNHSLITNEIRIVFHSRLICRWLRRRKITAISNKYIIITITIGESRIVAHFQCSQRALIVNKTRSMKDACQSSRGARRWCISLTGPPFAGSCAIDRSASR